MGIYSNGATASLVSGTGSADSITNNGSYSTINAGGGNDIIRNAFDSEKTTRYTEIWDGGRYSSINAGEGNDTIEDIAGYSTIVGGRGNDRVTLGNYSTLVYSNGDGNDTVYGYTYNFSSGNALNIASGAIGSTTTSGNDIVIKIGAGSIRLKDAKGMKLNIVDATEDSTVSAKGPLIKGTGGNDTLYAILENTTINASVGNDFVKNISTWGAYSVLNGGYGNDTLESNSPHIYLNGGEGSDRYVLNADYQTIRYANGDGNDVVVGYNSTDVIHLLDGSDYETTASGKDVLMKVGLGTITIKDAVGKPLNVDQTIFNPKPDWEIATSDSEYITFDKKKGIITVADGFNGEVNAADFGDVTAIDASAVSGSTLLRAGKRAAALKASQKDATLEGGAGSDKLYGNKGSDTFIYTVGQGQDVIGNTKEKNMLYQEHDKVAIVNDYSFDFTDLSIKDKKTSVVVTFNGDKRSKLTINKDSADTPITFLFGANSDTAIESPAVVYGELPEGVRYVKKNGTLDYTKLEVDDTLDGEIIDSALINTQIKNVDASNAEGYVEIIGNVNSNILKGGKAGSYLAGGAGNDQLYGSTEAGTYDTFVFQMQPGTKKDVIYNYDADDEIIIDTTRLEDGLPSFNAATGVITYDGAKSDFNGFNDTKNDVVITLNKKNTLTIKNAAGKAINLLDSDGNEIGAFGHFLPDGLIYNAKKTGIEVEDAALASTNGELDINITNKDEYEGIYFKTVMNVDLTDVAAAATITGNAKTNIIKAGAAHTEIRPGAGNDQIYSSTVEGSGVDFYYTSGKDIIYDYKPASDYVYIGGDTTLDYDTLATVTRKSFAEKGDDVILNLNKDNSITFKNAIGKVIEVFDDTGALDDSSGYIKYDFSLPNGLKYNNIKRAAIEIEDDAALVELNRLEIDLSNSSTEEDAYIYSDNVKKIDLSSIENESFNATLIGNAQANEFYAPNGGVNELYGGHQIFSNPNKAKPSADKLVGGSGSDTFVYAPGDGKDIISKYGAEDVIRLDNFYDDIESIALVDKKNVVSVTLNGDKNSVFTIEKRSINDAITFEGLPATINSREEWLNADENGFVYGPDEGMTLSADGTKLSLGGNADGYVLAKAFEVGSQIKVIDARSAEGTSAEIVGNGNANTFYAGSSGAIMDGGYDAIKKKATNDMMVGGSGEDIFSYSFELGLGGKDTISSFDVGEDIVRLDTAPKSVTANGKNVVLNFEEKIDGKKHTGILTINGTKAINSETTLDIEINGEVETYSFGSKLKNATWGSDPGITVWSGDSNPLIPDEGNTAAEWTKLAANSYAYSYGGVDFTVSGGAIKDQTPGNEFAMGAVLSVIDEDGIPDGILVDIHGKMIIFSDKFDRDNASFAFGNGESASDYDWAIFRTTRLEPITYLGEQPATDYWFTQTDQFDQAGDEIKEIMSTDNAVSFEEDFFGEAIKGSTHELTFAPKHRSKK